MLFETFAALFLAMADPGPALLDRMLDANANPMALCHTDTECVEACLLEKTLDPQGLDSFPCD